MLRSGSACLGLLLLGGLCVTASARGDDDKLGRGVCTAATAKVARINMYTSPAAVCEQGATANDPAVMTGDTSQPVSFMYITDAAVQTFADANTIGYKIHPCVDGASLGHPGTVAETVVVAGVAMARIDTWASTDTTCAATPDTVPSYPDGVCTKVGASGVKLTCAGGKVSSKFYLTSATCAGTASIHTETSSAADTCALPSAGAGRNADGTQVAAACVADSTDAEITEASKNQPAEKGGPQTSCAGVKNAGMCIKNGVLDTSALSVCCKSCEGCTAATCAKSQTPAPTSGVSPSALLPSMLLAVLTVATAMAN